MIFKVPCLVDTTQPIHLIKVCTMATTNGSPGLIVDQITSMVPFTYAQLNICSYVRRIPVSSSIEQMLIEVKSGDVTWFISRDKYAAKSSLSMPNHWLLLMLKHQPVS